MALIFKGLTQDLPLHHVIIRPLSQLYHGPMNVCKATDVEVCEDLAVEARKLMASDVPTPKWCEIELP